MKTLSTESRRCQQPKAVEKRSLEIILNLWSGFIVNPDSNLREACSSDIRFNPIWLREPPTAKGHGQCRRVEFNDIPEAKCALETNAPKANRVERSLIRIAEPAERGEVFLSEIFPVVREDKLPVVDANACLGGAGVVRVLQQL